MQTSKILLCQDILLEVLNHLAPATRHFGVCRDDEDEFEMHRSQCRKALVACAMVSRTMSQHALNVLWAELDDLGPVLQFLPGYHLRGRQNKFQTMRGAISIQAWSRLQSYASRVRSLTLTHTTRVHSTFWPFLARQCAGAPLLPNLRALDAFFITDLQVAPLLLLLCPSLLEVSIMFDEGPPGVDELSDILGSVLQNLALTAPQLKELSLLGNHSLHREHLLYLERFTSIQQIYLSHQFHLDGAVLQALSKIPTIRHLNVAVRLRNGDRKEELDFGDRFHGLRNLELRGKHKDVADVFIAISAPRLDLITLQFTDSPRMNAPDSPFSAIAPHVPDTVTHYSSTFCAALDPLPKSLANLLHPLPSLLPKLVAFNLTSEKSPLSVTNDDLAGLGDAWPHLERLNVGHSASRFNLKDVRRPDVWGLAALAKRCPELGMIALPELDISKPPGAATDSTDGRRAIPIPFLDHRLKELLFQSITASSTKAQHEAAVAIDMVFPHLDLRKMRPGDRGTSRSGPWANMWKTLEIMRWGRKNRALSEGGCESAVPEVPEMPGDGGDRRRHTTVHEVPNPHGHVWNMMTQTLMGLDDSGTESG